jgi:hypothetical protein
MNKLPKVVPLPTVEQYTDDIVFGGLGLPVGFDEERLQIHLRNIERVRLLGGLGQISVYGSRDFDKQSAWVEVDSSGAASIKKGLNINLDPSAQGEAQFNRPVSEQGVMLTDSVKSVIKVNLDKRDEILDKSKKQNAALNPGLHAGYLDRSLTRGLMHTSVVANADRQRLAFTGVAYGMLTLFEASIGMELKQGLALSIISRPLVVNGIIAAVYPKIKNDPDLKAQAEITGEEMPSLRETFSWFRQSLFWGAHLDRLALGAGTAAVSTFVTARK